VNLLGNAIKFTSARAGEPGRVTISAGAAKSPARDVRASSDGQWVYIRVEDTGRGIHPRDLRAIFEPFVQGDMTLTREHGGTGLGLAISRRLARLMGGDLTARSEPEVGSVFLLWLPAAPMESLSTGGVRGQGPPGAEARAEHEIAERRPTILRAVADALLAEVEEIRHAYVARLRTDVKTPSAYTVDDFLLEDHLATFLADLSATLAGVNPDAETPSNSLRDGSAIQRVIAERHGAQRERMGFAEHELRHEFVILEEELRAAVQRRLPAIAATPSRQSAMGEAGRAMVYLHQALHIAEERSLQGFQRARATGEQPGPEEQRANQSL
jgi:hypothetical protein